MLTKEEIITQTQALPKRDRVKVAASILGALDHRFDVPAILQAAMRACGVVEMDWNARNSRYMRARCIAAYALWKAGASDTQIGAAIHKYRSTAIYMRQKMESTIACPYSNLTLIRDYAKINELLNETD